MAKKKTDIAFEAKMVNRMIAKFVNSEITGFDYELLQDVKSNIEALKNKCATIEESLKPERIAKLEAELKILKGE